METPNFKNPTDARNQKQHIQLHQKLPPYKAIQIRIANYLFSSRIIENGVPQESVLSVSLFLLAINDAMTNLSNLVKGFLFADDLTIICRGKNPPPKLYYRTV